MRLCRPLATAIFLAATLSACAQSPSQADADHDAHHPETAPTTTAQAAPATNPQRGPAMMNQPGGMMGQGSSGMMSGTMMPMTGMMMNESDAADHMKDRLSALKTKLGITPTEEPKWNAFVAAAGENAKAMMKLRGQMMSRGQTPSTLPQRLAAEDKAAEAHLKAMKKTTAALNDLYRALSPEQKTIADQMALGPMGMPMGMM